MNAIIDFLEGNKKTIFTITTSILFSYLAYRTHKQQTNQPRADNLLSVSLNQLIKDSTTQSITKIVIATCPSSKGNFRRELINQLKKKLNQQNIKVLINCSPQKLLIAGSQCFLQSMQQNDSQYVEYYYNLLRNQFLIEDTISKIELISQKNNQIVMICDNSPVDIKLLNQSDNLWGHFLQKYDLQEDEILKSYALVFHIIQEDSKEEEDKRIEASWKGSGYFCVKVGDNTNNQTDFQSVFKKIKSYLEDNYEKSQFSKGSFQELK